MGGRQSTQKPAQPAREQCYDEDSSDMEDYWPSHSRDSYSPPLPPQLLTTEEADSEEEPMYDGDVERLDQEIWEFHSNNKMTQSEMQEKPQAGSWLLSLAFETFGEENVRMHVGGSSANGCGARNCDLDLCLEVCDPNGDRPTRKKYVKSVLNAMYSVLKQSEYYRQNPPFFDAILINAKVPLIRVQTDNFEVDITCNNFTGIRNSNLIYHYALVDTRFPALCLFIKNWALGAGIKDPRRGMLNSYALTLMAIHYLQCGVDPPVLPNLQHRVPHWFSHPDLDMLKRAKNVQELLPGYQSCNGQSIGTLLIGFFYYYATFDFLHFGISIATGNFCDRPRGSSSYIYIKEPCENNKYLNCVHSIPNMLAIRGVFRNEANRYYLGRFSPFPMEDSFAKEATLFWDRLSADKNKKIKNRRMLKQQQRLSRSVGRKTHHLTGHQELQVFSLPNNPSPSTQQREKTEKLFPDASEKNTMEEATTSSQLLKPSNDQKTESASEAAHNPGACDQQEGSFANSPYSEKEIGVTASPGTEKRMQRISALRDQHRERFAVLDGLIWQHTLQCRRDGLTDDAMIREDIEEIEALNDMAGGNWKRFTDLIIHYSKIDDRFMALYIFLHEWAYATEVNGDHEEALTNDSLLILLIHLLQSGVTPAVLPNLHYLCRHEEWHREDLSFMFQQRNSQTLTELLVAFFDYYVAFDFKKFSISISIKCSDQSAPQDPEAQMVILDPIDFENTAWNVKTKEVMRHIRKCLREGKERLYDLSLPFQLPNKVDKKGNLPSHQVKLQVG